MGQDELDEFMDEVPWWLQVNCYWAFFSIVTVQHGMPAALNFCGVVASVTVDENKKHARKGIVRP
jgi:hypothetical protein